MNTSIWHDLAPDHGVLDVHADVMAPGAVLDLHIVVDSETDLTIAWWTVAGLWLAAVAVGEA